MGIVAKDQHGHTVFEIRGEDITGPYGKRIYTFDGREFKEASHRKTLYSVEIKRNSLYNWIDRSSSNLSERSYYGSGHNFNLSARSVGGTKGGTNLSFSDDVPYPLATILGIEFESGRVFDRGLSDFERFGILLGGAQMVRSLEKDGFTLANLAKYGLYHNMGYKAQNEALVAYGVMAAKGHGLSVKKVLGLIAFRALDKQTQKAAAKAYAGARFLKKSDFSLAAKLLISSGFDDHSRSRFAMFYAAKEYFEEKGVLVEKEENVVIGESDLPEQKALVTKESPRLEPQTSTDEAVAPLDQSDYIKYQAKPVKKASSFRMAFWIIVGVISLVVIANNITFSPKSTTTLKVITIEETWMRVTSGGKVVYEGTLAPGKEITFRSKDEFHFRLGNAGGVRFNLNGKEIGPPGKSGQVIKDYKLGK